MVSEFNEITTLLKYCYYNGSSGKNSFVELQKLNLLIAYLLAKCQVDIVEINDGTDTVSNFKNSGKDVGKELFFSETKNRTIGGFKFWKIDDGSKDVVELSDDDKEILSISASIKKELVQPEISGETISGAFGGYVFHINDFLEEYEEGNATWDQIKSNYSKNPRFKVFLKVFEDNLGKVIRTIIDVGLKDDNEILMNQHFVLGHPSGSAMYLFTSESIKKFESINDFKMFLRSPQKILREKDKGLFSSLSKPNRYGPCWTVYKESELPAVVDYVRTHKELWRIERNALFPVNGKGFEIYFQAAIPFISIDNIHLYLYLVGSMGTTAEIQTLRNIIKEISKYLFLHAGSSYEFINLMETEWNNEKLKKDLMEKELFYSDSQSQLLMDGGYSASIKEYFKLNGTEENTESLFARDGGGWFDQFFNYAFTEDVYYISLRVIKKILKKALGKNGIGVDSSNEVYDYLASTLDLFFTFQDQARNSNISYRDHLLHQFQVFLLGLKVISSKWFKEIISDRYNIEDIIFYWSFASLFHDVGYSFEKIDTIQREYIVSLLKLNKDYFKTDKVSSDIFFGKIEKSKFDFGLELENMIDRGAKYIEGNDDSKKKLRWLFKKLFAEERNHAVTSSFFVFHNVFSKNFGNLKSDWINRALSAILFHDKRVWIECALESRYLPFKKFEKYKEVIQEYIKSKFGDHVHERIASALINEPSISPKISEMKRIIPWYCSNGNNSQVNELPADCPYDGEDLHSGGSPTVYFMLDHFYKKSPLSYNPCSEERVFKHKIEPKKNPLQFLLILADTIQLKGRSFRKLSANESDPEIRFDPDADDLKFTIKRKANGGKGTIEYLKTYLDFYLLDEILNFKITPSFTDSTALSDEFTIEFKTED